MELIPLLMQFADECDQKKYNLSTFISSDGHEGVDEPMHGTSLDRAVRPAAARLGSRISARSIKLEIAKARAESYIANATGNVDEAELNECILSFLALLSLRARWIVDMAATEAGLGISHPPGELDRLLNESTRHSFEIDSGNELHWH